VSSPSLALSFEPPGAVRAAPRDYSAGLETAPRSALLSEAVRFFDLRNQGKRGILKKNWPRLTFDILDRAARLLRFG
jgi:hypothetical protein